MRAFLLLAAAAPGAPVRDDGEGDDGNDGDGGGPAFMAWFHLTKPKGTGLDAEAAGSYLDLPATSEQPVEAAAEGEVAQPQPAAS